MMTVYPYIDPELIVWLKMGGFVMAAFVLTYAVACR